MNGIWLILEPYFLQDFLMGFQILNAFVKIQVHFYIGVPTLSMKGFFFNIKFLQEWK